MGLFTPAQIVALGEPTVRIRQKWTFLYPSVTSPDVGPPDTEIVIHDGLTIKRVIDAGSREAEAYNQTLADPGDLRLNNYTFTVSNGDHYFDFGKPGSIWDQGIMLDPIQCAIRHQVYLNVNGTWEELAFVRFQGAIISVDYKSVGSKGKSVNVEAIISCENAGLFLFADKVWHVNDGQETDMNLTIPKLDNS